MACAVIYTCANPHGIFPPTPTLPIIMDQYACLPSQAASSFADPGTESSGRQSGGAKKQHPKRGRVAARLACRRPLIDKTNLSTEEEALKSAPNLRPESPPGVEAEIISPDVREEHEIPDPQELLNHNFNDPFNSTALPTDARSTFYLHHCECSCAFHPAILAGHV